MRQSIAALILTATVLVASGCGTTVNVTQDGPPMGGVSKSVEATELLWQMRDFGNFDGRPRPLALLILPIGAADTAASFAGDLATLPATLPND